MSRPSWATASPLALLVQCAPFHVSLPQDEDLWLILGQGDQPGSIDEVRLSKAPETLEVDSGRVLYLGTMNPDDVKGAEGGELRFDQISAALQGGLSACGCRGSVDASPAILLPGDECQLPRFVDWKGYEIGGASDALAPESIKSAIDKIRLLRAGACGCESKVGLASQEQIQICSGLPQDPRPNAIALGKSGELLIHGTDDTWHLVNDQHVRLDLGRRLRVGVEMVVGPIGPTTSAVEYLVWRDIRSPSVRAELIRFDGQVLSVTQPDLTLSSFAPVGAVPFEHDLLAFGGLGTGPAIFRCSKAAEDVVCSPEVIDDCATAPVLDLAPATGNAPAIAVTELGQVLERTESGWRCMQLQPPTEDRFRFTYGAIASTERHFALGLRTFDDDSTLFVGVWGDASPRHIQSIPGTAYGIGFVLDGQVLVGEDRAFRLQDGTWVESSTASLADPVGIPGLESIRRVMVERGTEIIMDGEERIYRRRPGGAFQPVYRSFPHFGISRTAMVGLEDGSFFTADPRGSGMEVIEVPEERCDAVRARPLSSIEAGPSRSTRFAIRAQDDEFVTVGGTLDEPAGTQWIQRIQPSTGEVSPLVALESSGEVLSAMALSREVVVFASVEGRLTAFRNGMAESLTVVSDDPATPEKEVSEEVEWISLAAGVGGIGWAGGQGHVGRIVDGGPDAGVRLETFWLSRISRNDPEAFSDTESWLGGLRSGCSNDLSFAEYASGKPIQGWSFRGGGLHRLDVLDAFTKVNRSTWLGPPESQFLIEAEVYAGDGRFMGPFSLWAGAVAGRNFLVGGRWGEWGVGWVAE